MPQCEIIGPANYRCTREMGHSERCTVSELGYQTLEDKERERQARQEAQQVKRIVRRYLGDDSRGGELAVDISELIDKQCELSYERGLEAGRKEVP